MRCPRVRSKPSTGRSRSGCAPGSSGRPASVSAMSNSSIRSATATGSPATPRRRCRRWSSPISPWSARRGRPARPMPNGRAGTGFSRGRIGARESRRCSAAIEAALARWAAAAAGEAERRLREERLGSPSGCPARRGTRSWSSNATNSLPGGAGRRGAARSRPAGAAAGWTRDRRGDGARPSPHPGDRDRPAARQDQIRPVVFELMPPGFTLLQLQRTVEALAGRAAAQAEFPPAGRAAGPGRGDRRDQRRHRRPAGPPRPLPPRGVAGAAGARPASARRPPRRRLR